MPERRGRVGKKENFVLKVTPEDWQEEIDKGADPRDALKPGKHIFRRGTFFKRHGVTAAEMKNRAQDPRNTQIELTVPLDSDIYKWFEEQAAMKGALDFGSQINEALRLFKDRTDAIREFKPILTSRITSQIMSEIMNVLEPYMVPQKKQTAKLKHS